MHPDIKKLLELQRVDKTLARIRRDLTSLPAEEERRQQRLDQLRRAADGATAALQQAEVAARGQEKGILAADEEIKKLQVRLNTVKNNAEYQATLFQIEAVKKERGQIEDEGVALLDQLEGLRDQAAAAASKVEADAAVFAEFQGEAAKIREAREKDLAQAGAGRDELTKGIPRDLLEKYQSLFETRDGDAVSAVENNVCMGCYTQVTPNDHARLVGASAIVHCGSCQRILYIPEG